MLGFLLLLKCDPIGWGQMKYIEMEHFIRYFLVALHFGIIHSLNMLEQLQLSTRRAGVGK